MAFVTACQFIPAIIETTELHFMRSGLVQVFVLVTDRYSNFYNLKETESTLTDCIKQQLDYYVCRNPVLQLVVPRARTECCSTGGGPALL